MSEANYRPSGELQGDSRPMPNRGTGTGMNGDGYGADLSPDATNRSGSMTGATRSHPADKCSPPNPQTNR